MLQRLRAYLLIGIWAAGLGLVGPFVIPLRMLTGREEFITYPSGFFVWLGLKVARVRVTVEGRGRVDPDGTYVYVCNHQSVLDPPIIWLTLGSRRRRVAYLVKKEIGRVPVLGFGVQQIGMLLVDRSNSERATESARRASAAIKGGRSFAVFAEGTRTRNGRLLPFKKGAFHMAVAAGVPVVPVTIDGAYEAMPPDTFRLRSVPIRVTIHEPIPTAGLRSDDVHALVARAHAAVAAPLGNPAAAGGV
jgi:1-acyl-sn-glycerol-3-phosphate acyltransferase